MVTRQVWVFVPKPTRNISQVNVEAVVQDADFSGFPRLRKSVELLRNRLFGPGGRSMRIAGSISFAVRAYMSMRDPVRGGLADERVPLHALFLEIDNDGLEVDGGIALIL
jgi:hypothetical protein